MDIHEILKTIDTFIEEKKNETNKIQIYARSYDMIVEKLNTLYDKEIDPGSVSITQTLKDKLTKKGTTINNNKSKNEEFLCLIEKDKQYEQEEQTLLKEYEELKIRLEKIEDLKKKSDELKKQENQFDSLDNEVKNIHLKNDEIVGKLIQILDSVNELLSYNTTKIDEQLRTHIEQAKKNLTNLNAKSKEIIRSLNKDPLETRSKVLNDELGRLIADYNSYVEKIQSIDQELKTVEKKYSSIVEQYNKRYHTDTIIYGNLDERGNVEKYIYEHVKEIEKFFEQFEKMLNDLKEKRQQMKLSEIYEKRYDNGND